MTKPPCKVNPQWSYNLAAIKAKGLKIDYWGKVTSRDLLAPCGRDALAYGEDWYTIPMLRIQEPAKLFLGS